MHQGAVVGIARLGPVEQHHPGALPLRDDDGVVPAFDVGEAVGFDQCGDVFLEHADSFLSNVYPGHYGRHGVCRQRQLDHLRAASAATFI